jgi:hypothetical protein
VLLATLSAGLAFASSASAGRFVVQQGAKRGLALSSPDSSPCFPPDGCSIDNRGLGAKGAVHEGEVGCPQFDYHGTLLGRPDPDPGACGWGSIFPVNGNPGPIGTTAFAITHETLALRSHSLDAAKRDTKKAIADLDNMSQFTLDATEQSEVADARALDVVAKRLFAKAAHRDGAAKRRTVRKAKSKLKQALVTKRELFDRVSD